MLNLVFALFLFLEIFSYLIIADVILSWLTLFGLNIRPIFISSVLDPIYLRVKNTIPTTIGPLDLTPIVVLLAIGIMQAIVLSIFPEVSGLIGLLK